MFYPFASIGSNVSIHFTSQISRALSPRIQIGNTVSVKDHVWLVVATPDPAGNPTIVIDDRCVIATGSIISAKNCVHLERSVNVAQQVLIVDHNHAYEDPVVPIIEQGITPGGRITIGEGSWIGHGAAIICSRGDLTIGRHCIVSSNSVVTQSVPDHSVVFGAPATIIRHYDPEKRIWRMGPRSARPTAAPEKAAALSSAGQYAETLRTR